MAALKQLFSPEFTEQKITRIIKSYHVYAQIA